MVILSGNKQGRQDVPCVCQMQSLLFLFRKQEVISLVFLDDLQNGGEMIRVLDDRRVFQLESRQFLKYTGRVLLM